jgi:hypothetical protein
MNNMKKILLILLSLISITTYSQQRLVHGGGLTVFHKGEVVTAPVVVGVSSYSMEVTRYINGLSTPLHDTVITNINDFVVALKDSLNIDSLTQVFDVMYVFANGTSEAALRNLVERDNDATEVGDPVFTAFEGYNADTTSTDNYINSNYNPSSEAINLTVNSATIGAYSRTALVGASGWTEIGSREGLNVNMFYLRMNAAGNTNWPLFFNGSLATATPGSTAAFFTITRTASDASAFYWNKTEAATSAAEASAIYDGDIFICSLNNGGSPSNNSSRQLSLVYIAEGLTKAQSDDIVDCFERYMDDNSKGVIP